MEIAISDADPLCRILIVEDYTPFRHYLCSVLRKRDDLLVIGEARDGLEGVQQAVDLRPDVILLDVGLPTINGIEVARLVRKLVPDSKIVFVSQESSFDVIQEAFRAGASGYVLKAEAASQLLAVVGTAISGRVCQQRLGQP